MPKSSNITFQLEQARAVRASQNLISDAYRFFHGPGEGVGPLSLVSIDIFQDEVTKKRWAWITDFSEKSHPLLLQEIVEFLMSDKVNGAVRLSRAQPGQAPEPPQALFGEVPENLTVLENEMRFSLRLKSARHPGLFLDHEPLREWLKANTPPNATVLNTFCYTGSLSVASKHGGAKDVLNLDLSSSYLKWSKLNWELNGFQPTDLKCVEEDTLYFLPKLAKQGKKFDVVILDPPSFARSPHGTFSTKKDLARLHLMALDVLAPGGLLITSINSESVSKNDYLTQVKIAFENKNLKFQILKELGQPPSFPVLHQKDPALHYLKGWIFKDITLKNVQK